MGARTVYTCDRPGCGKEVKVGIDYIKDGDVMTFTRRIASSYGILHHHEVFYLCDSCRAFFDAWISGKE